MTTGNRIRQYVSEGAGSGVKISGDGYIATNRHVIEGASKIIVRLRSGEEYSAELIGGDSKTDIAVLKISAEGLVAAVYGDSDSLTRAACGGDRKSARRTRGDGYTRNNICAEQDHNHRR